MPWCVVIGCRNNMKATKRAGKDVSYHIFPKNPQRRTAWINSLNRPFKFNADSSYVCSEHFITDDFECYSLKEELLNIKVKRQLKKTAVPSINITKISGEEQLEGSVVNHLTSQSANEIITMNNSSNTDEFHMHVEQRCAVPTCKNNINKPDKPNSSTAIVFHKFPSNTEVLEKWLEFCKCSKEFFLKHQNIQICSEHFNEDNYELRCTAESMHPIKELRKDAVPHLNGAIKIEDISNDESVKKRKMIVDKLLADYEEQQKNEGLLNGSTKYFSFFSPKINPNAKLADKLKLLKAIDNREKYSPPKKKKTSKLNSGILEAPLSNDSFQNKDQVIQVSAVRGGLMLHALIPQTTDNTPNTCSEKSGADEEEEIIIVTEDEASHADLSSYKEKNTEIIVVTNLKETEDTVRFVESVPAKCSVKANDCVNNKCRAQDRLENSESQFTPLYTAKVSLMEDKGCQVIVPCKGCENRSLKINKLLRERTRLLRDLNHNGAWRDPDEITALKRMNGVLSLLLMKCVGEKYGKKSSSIRVDSVQDSIERINRGWSMHDTSETLCQALSSNAYDEFARTFEIINEI